MTISLDGGDPIDLLGDMVLCSRDAISDDRHFTGSLAHLSLFDKALLPSQVPPLIYMSCAQNRIPVNDMTI